MGVISTGSIFKTLTFDGRSSSEFNVYITGEGVFNAPERAVEMISIPGRNGAFALDYGRFENIEVTYNCGIAGDNDADFASAISDFRNWLCSRNGYVRLTDDYNAGEYRMAIYKSGLEVTAENLKAGEFPIVFECKPQRFLTSGENTISVTSGDTITNPALFDARPLLEVTGYGNIGINNETITIENIVIGMTQLTPKTLSNEVTITDTSIYNVGDDIVVKSDSYVDQRIVFPSNVTSVNYTKTTDTLTTELRQVDVSNKAKSFLVLLPEITFSAGTNATYNNVYNITVTTSGGTNYTGTLGLQISYYGNTITLVETCIGWTGATIGGVKFAIGEVWADSSISILGNPAYIDLDIGEAWNEDSGTPVSINNAVIMPAELPTLTPGANTITYDNTITGLDIVPRWFKI